MVMDKGVDCAGLNGGIYKLETIETLREKKG